MELKARLAAAFCLGFTMCFPPSTAGAEDDVVTIVLTGDTGFSRNHSPVHPTGVLKYGKRPPFRATLSGIAAEINGNLNFTNIETVVTDRNNLRRDTKGQKGPFNFRTHPNGIRALTATGFNVFSLANNHAMDYGPAGLRETLRHMARIPGAQLKAAAGLGENRDVAGKPHLIRVKWSGIAYAAMGIVTNNLERHRAGKNKPGQMAYRFDADFRETLGRLAATPADFRMLSIHYGVEGKVRADARQIRDWRQAAAIENGINLVVGHHAHVVRAVERAGSSVIFYGLGNFLHHGTANITGKSICKNYGLMARVHLRRDGYGILRTRAVEAIPVTNTHIRTTRLPAAQSRARVHVLNYLASKLPGGGGDVEGMRFRPMADGRGLYCFDGAGNESGSIGTLCRGWTPAPPIPSSLKRRIAAACAR
ncbi:MAG: CapA family protein [Hyphomicrobiaceae bacterium]